MSWYCPECLKSIPESSRRCSYCGLDFDKEMVGLASMKRISSYIELGILNIEVSCPSCDGTGRGFCPICGNRIYVGGTSQAPTGGKCEACDGWGYDRNSSCSVCSGSGRMTAQRARQTSQRVPRQKYF